MFSEYILRLQYDSAKVVYYFSQQLYFGKFHIPIKYIEPHLDPCWFCTGVNQLMSLELFSFHPISSSLPVVAAACQHKDDNLLANREVISESIDDWSSQSKICIVNCRHRKQCQEEEWVLVTLGYRLFSLSLSPICFNSEVSVTGQGPQG